MKKKYDYFIYYFPLFAFLFIGMGSFYYLFLYPLVLLL